MSVSANTFGYDVGRRVMRPTETGPDKQSQIILRTCYNYDRKISGSIQLRGFRITGSISFKAIEKQLQAFQNAKYIDLREWLNSMKSLDTLQINT